jgi:hypothetical protein
MLAPDTLDSIRYGISAKQREYGWCALDSSTLQGR